MNIIIAGYGRMGRLIEQTAMSRAHTLTAVIDPVVTEKTAASGAPVYAGLPDVPHPTGSVVIDFTHPSVVLANIYAYLDAGLSAVIGTTGWYGSLEAVKAKAAETGGALLYAPNFSLGVNLFYRIAREAARAVNPFPEYDAAVFEVHHNQKADAPSGTAKTLAETVLSVMTRKKRAVYAASPRPGESEALHIASMRVGSVPGTHMLVFDSPDDTIEITHRARGRAGFASGALAAAEWLGAAKRKGVFTLEDALASPQ